VNYQGHVIAAALAKVQLLHAAGKQLAACAVAAGLFFLLQGEA
jgi:hypothetical protein